MDAPEPTLPTAAPSNRVRFAELAREAALGVPGVVGLDAGPSGRHATIGGGTRVAGVVSAAAPGGGFDLSLRLVCELGDDLRAVGDRVRNAVLAAAAGAGLRADSVAVEITDVTEPGS